MMSFFQSLSALRHLTHSTVLLIALQTTSLLVAESPYQGTTSIFIPYANVGSNQNLDKSPTLNIGFDGNTQHVPFVMDTGSVGIVASSDIFTPAPGAKNLGAGHQYYSSSGIIEEGTWWSATQQIYDANGNVVATANVPVLQVTSIKCAKGARSCKPNQHPKGIALMGIGFARESKQQPRGTPAYNAFLNLQSILKKGTLQALPSDWCKGYVITPKGVSLGLTASNTAKAGFVKLMPWTKYSTKKLSEWKPAPMTVSVNDVSGNGNILMDTGVGTAYLTPPANADIGDLVACPGSSLVQCLPKGTTVGVYLPNQANPVAYYTFTVGESSNLMQPSGVHVVKAANVFLNTSRHVLGGLNFIYDNTNGYIGYVWNGLSGSSVGYVKPATASSSTIISSSKHVVKAGKKVKFTATVMTSDSDAADIPTGTVAFMINNKLRDTITLNQKGKAIFSSAHLPVGVHQIVAHYSGDANYIRSTSQAYRITVKK